MSYFRPDLPVSPIEELLNKLESAAAEDLSADNQSLPADVPTLEQFLNEEDVLRECRSDNKRLIAYLCQPHIIRKLVENSFSVPPVFSPVSDANGQSPSDASPTSEEQANIDEAQRSDRDLHMKHAYVSSELLTSDSKLISEATLGNKAVMTRIFSCVEGSETGRLNTGVAVYFAKVIMSLLKLRNAQVIEQMSDRGSSFINGILKHMDSGPIAELVVRILDSPEPDQAYPSSGNKRPTDEALDLLVRADLFGGLAECFVKASSDKYVTDVTALTGIGDSGYNDGGEQDSVVSEQDAARQRRLREETMANVTMTILGLTERMLQLPELGCRIPDKLSPYSTPTVISRLLDAGLYANCGSDKHGVNHSTRKIYADTEQERAEAFSTGCNSALLHSLGLAADLMTTEANVLRDDEDDVSNEADHPAGVPGRHMGVGQPTYSGKGIGPSVMASDSKPSEDPEEPAVADKKPPMLPELMDKKVGDNIVETVALENELAIRFPRLAGMFGDNDVEESGRMRPLGSLRLKLAEFFVACMKKASQDTVDQIRELGVPKKLLELFGKYQWSSMLHGVVTNSVVSALEGEEVGRPARVAWFQAGLISWLMDSWSRNAKVEEEGSVRTRAGYMGHLIRIGTALKGYIEENQSDPHADLPDKEELEAFAVFSEQVLAPAHFRESTPLCEELPTDSGTEGDEGEEARDVLEMGGISFVDNVMNDNKAVKQHEELEEEEEIKPVEVDDLEHFGADDEDENTVTPVVDHDIPAAMREKLSKVEDDGPIKSITVTDEATAVIGSSSSPGEREGSKDKRPSTKSSGKPSVKSSVKASVVGEAADQDELREVIDTVDSSSEDEGSYEAFVDDRRDGNALKDTSEKLERLGLSDSEPADASLEGAVTEIEEPGPLNSGGDLLQSLASNVVSVSDDALNSSDEEYEAWEDPVRVVDSSTPDRPLPDEKPSSEAVQREVA